MRKIFYVIVALLAVGFVGCQTEQTIDYQVSSDRVTVQANRRGIDSNGGQVILNVTSNTYWILNVDEAAAEWISFTPKAAPAGTTEVFVTIAENTDVARMATLVFDTQMGVKEQVTINQHGVDEQLSYYCETFGQNPVTEDTNINRFDEWETTGFGSNLTIYDGDLSITSTNPSTIEGASGGNSLLFSVDNQELIIGPIGIYGDEFFCFSFGVNNRNGVVSASELKVYAGDNGKDWFPFAYTVDTTMGWTKAVGDFSLKKNIATDIYFKFVAPAGYEIDDIVMLQGYAEDNAPMVRISMDSNPIGYVFFADDLNWITRDFANTVDANIPFADGYSVCNMYMHSNASVPAESKALWIEKGYTTPPDRGERTWNYAYVEVDTAGDGHFKIGRASQSNARKHTGSFTLPLKALEKIDVDAEISVLFSMDVGRYSTSDANVCYVTATTNGVSDKREIVVAMDKIKTYGTFEVSFDNVTRDTTFEVYTEEQADGRSIRLYFDNFKITKL